MITVVLVAFSLLTISYFVVRTVADKKLQEPTIQLQQTLKEQQEAHNELLEKLLNKIEYIEEVKKIPEN